jgi:hypothetical protein
MTFYTETTTTTQPHVSIADCIEILKLQTMLGGPEDVSTCAAIVRAQAMAAKRVEDALRESGK